MAAAEFFAAARAAFERHRTIQVRDYAIAGQTVRVRFGSEPLLRRLTPALAHRPRPESGGADLDVMVFDGETAPARLPAPPWGPDCYGARGEITGFNDERFRTVYQPGIDILQMYDRQSRQALYWAPTWRLVPYWEQSFPLRTLLHWWCEDQAWTPVHAGAVGRGGEGVLVAGKSGSGKSTSTLACLEGGLDYAGDDYVLLDARGAPAAECLYSTAKLVPDNLFRFPRLREQVTNADRLDDEKALLYVNESHGRQVANAMRLRAILLPRVTGRRETRLTPATAAAAVFAIAPTTILHLPNGAAGVMEKVSRVARQLPVYWLEAGTELEQIPRVVESLLSSGRSTQAHAHAAG